MFKLGLIILATLVVSECRFFDNPVLDNADYPDPGVILEDGVYYAATTTNNKNPEKYPIHKSTDLQNWELVGYIFNASNLPSWSNKDYEFWAPEIHKIGNEYRAYFTSRDSQLDTVVVGVAHSKNLLGPYTATDRPLHAVGGVYVLDSSIINQDGHLMLIWVESLWIRMRNLTPDGLAFADDNVILVLKPELEWEGVTTEGPWYLKRNDWHYIFYSANNFCSDTYSLAVARSRNITGPYEKYPQPILVSNEPFKGPGHGSIVKDIDGESYVFVHHAWKKDYVCGDNVRLMFSTSMEWGDDDWPKKMEMTYN